MTTISFRIPKDIKFDIPLSRRICIFVNSCSAQVYCKCLLEEDYERFLTYKCRWKKMTMYVFLCKSCNHYLLRDDDTKKFSKRQFHWWKQQLRYLAISMYIEYIKYTTL